jgi:hypothetical protein
MDRDLALPRLLHTPLLNTRLDGRIAKVPLYAGYSTRAAGPAAPPYLPDGGTVADRCVKTSQFP